jgi:hypothetical protein
VISYCFVRGPQGRSHSLTERRRGAVPENCLSFQWVPAGEGEKFSSSWRAEATPVLVVAPERRVRLGVAALFYSWVDGSFIGPPDSESVKKLHSRFRAFVYAQ